MVVGCSVVVYTFVFSLQTGLKWW